MSGKRGQNQSPRRGFTIWSNRNGRRDYYEHDDRGYAPRSSNYSEGSFHGGRRGGSRKYWVNQVWEGGIASAISSGSWRGQLSRGRNSGGTSRNTQYSGYHDDSRSRHQQMYKESRGQRRGKSRTWNRNEQKHLSVSYRGWQKIIVRDGAKLKDDDVVAAIKSLVEEPFVPVMFDVEGNSMVFYVEDNAPAVKAIMQISRRVVCMGMKLIFSTNSSPPPYKALTSSQIQSVKEVMSCRYSVQMARLDLRNFHNDNTLLTAGIFCPLYRQPNMSVVVDIIAGNIPSVNELDLSHNKIYSVAGMEKLVNTCTNVRCLSLEKNLIQNIEQLEKFKGMKVTDLCLVGNPLCNKYQDTESYVSAVRKIFPKVLYLDGQELPKPIEFEVDEEITKLPPTKPSFFCSEEAKFIILKFIEQYYQCFDNGADDRRPLEAAYTENASFSLSCTFPDTGPNSSCTLPYIKESRNLKKCTRPETRVKRLVTGRSGVVDVLCRLPNTTHEPSSFVVDIPVAEAQLVHVVVSGLFRQYSDRKNLIRSFMRTLIIVPQGSGLCICNEELFVNPATFEQIKGAFKPNTKQDPATQTTAVASNVGNASPAVAAASLSEAASPVSTENLTAVQQEMVTQFCKESGMLPYYSQQCLQENNWDYTKAGSIFLVLKQENKIPLEYFLSKT